MKKKLLILLGIIVAAIVLFYFYLFLTAWLSLSETETFNAATDGNAASQPPTARL